MVESDTTSGDERVVDGRYRLVRPLGRGAMGAVYEAVRLVDGARVAVKLVHPHLSKNDVNAARFAREVRLTQELDHPGIIRTFDAGLDGDGSLFLVMELLEGQTLARSHRVGPVHAGPGGVDPHRGAPRAGGGAPGGHRAPRSEAREHLLGAHAEATRW
jgi:hypothetical protein